MNCKKWKTTHFCRNLIMPCCRDILGCLLREKAALKLNTTPFLNDTIHRMIAKMSENVKNQVISQIKKASLGVFLFCQAMESTS